MNYLAHSFLSGDDEELLVGNFIADSVRGSQLHLYPDNIARGIVLHRQIDAFTDSHPVVQLSKKRLRPAYHKFAGVVSDIFFHHFLAINFDQYSTVGLFKYTQFVYDSVKRHQAFLPERVKYFLPYMVEQNWLLNYANLEGIRRSLTGLSRRTTFKSNMETATDELQRNYHLYLHEFNLFFPDLIAFVKEKEELKFRG